MILDGKAAAARIRAELKPRAAAFEARTGRKIGLAVVVVGEDSASAVYVRNKLRACEEVGIAATAAHLPETVSQEEVEQAVKAFAEDGSIDGILVQLPLPARLDAARILACIPTEKDVDGFSAENLGLLAQGEPCMAPCTPRGVMELLAQNGVEICGKRAVVVGRSRIVGKPMAMLLLNADATVTVCHSRSADLAEECRRADILVVAVGKPAFITDDMVKEGAVVVDVGINRVDGKLVGDVAESVSKKASFMTPVPGGVGPMTVAMLLCNTAEAAERRV